MWDSVYGVKTNAKRRLTVAHASPTSGSIRSGRSDLQVEIRGRLAQYSFSTDMVVSFFLLLVRKPDATLLDRKAK